MRSNSQFCIETSVGRSGLIVKEFQPRRTFVVVLRGPESSLGDLIVKNPYTDP